MEPTFTTEITGLSTAQVEAFMADSTRVSDLVPREINLGGGPVKVRFSYYGRMLSRDGTWAVLLKGEFVPEQ